jgi:hypothetical protein
MEENMRPTTATDNVFDFQALLRLRTPAYTENLIRVYDVKESPKLAE